MYKLFIRLEEPIRGLNHLNAVDPEQFAEIHSTDIDARRLGLTPFQDFIIYEGEYGNQPDQWHDAADALQTTRGLIAFYGEQFDRWDESIRSKESVQRDLKTLSDLLRVFESAEEKGIRFCLVSNY